MADKQALEKVERLEGVVARQRNKLAEGARIGASTLITAMGGGVISGFIQKKQPTIGEGTVSTNGAVGVTLVVGALSGVAGEYSDEIAALGAGILAAAISREAEAYFDPPATT